MPDSCSVLAEALREWEVLGRRLAVEKDSALSSRLCGNGLYEAVFEYNPVTYHPEALRCVFRDEGQDLLIMPSVWGAGLADNLHLFEPRLARLQREYDELRAKFKLG